MTVDRAEFDRLVSHVKFVDRFVIHLATEFLAMSTNLDALIAAKDQAISTIATLATMLASEKAKSAELQAQLDAGASDDAALPAITQGLTDAVASAQGAVGG